MMLEKVDPSVVGVSQERLERITRWLEQQVGEGKLAGASALVARRGKIAYLRCGVSPTRKTARCSPRIPSCASIL